MIRKHRGLIGMFVADGKELDRNEPCMVCGEKKDSMIYESNYPFCQECYEARLRS